MSYKQIAWEREGIIPSQGGVGVYYPLKQIFSAQFLDKTSVREGQFSKSAVPERAYALAGAAMGGWGGDTLVTNSYSKCPRARCSLRASTPEPNSLLAACVNTTNSLIERPHCPGVFSSSRKVYRRFLPCIAAPKPRAGFNLD